MSAPYILHTIARGTAVVNMQRYGIGLRERDALSCHLIRVSGRCASEPMISKH